MRFHAIPLLAALTLSAAASGAPVRFVCENWHPRLGQVNDLLFAVDIEQKTCNGQPCKISGDDFRWSEQGGRYEHVVNQQTGEGYVYFAASSERTAILKNCRRSDK